jgi:hypothetical protein
MADLRSLPAHRAGARVAPPASKLAGFEDSFESTLVGRLALRVLCQCGP